MIPKLIISISLVYLISPVICYIDIRADGDDSDNGSFNIRLNRQKTAFEQHLNNAHILKKHNIDFYSLYKKHHHKANNRTNDSIALYRYIDNEFYGKIVIGHPGQTLNVAFDTAWSLSWVLSSECSGSFSLTNIGCLFHNTYNHKRSSEYRPDGRKIVVPDGNSELSGYFSFDNISIAHSNVTDFSFVEMTKVPFNLLFSKIDGVLGLGLQNDAYKPFFYTLLDQGKIKEPIFTVYLNRDKQSDHGGNVIMGFIEMRHVHSRKGPNNETIYDPIKYMPVKPGYLWQFDLDSVYIANASGPIIRFCTSGKCNAITDTSSNNILGPPADIEAIHAAMEAKPFYLNRSTVNCDTINKLPVINFTIGGQDFMLKGRDYTVKLSYLSITICLSAFVPHDYTDFWVLGGAFLSEYYTIYNVQDKRIGIVKAA
ncbi:unnamed protein product [Ceutorhynchus assimilis]|uniref:Peptidase A1 domain-containing protein n=1 Tax=Ceutorhynchus assimilis TaxID=467358 RepID=A0A9N9MMN7_9CUCU|nr:unnamed protein product [Ceutorhynchus assimilis]